MGAYSPVPGCRRDLVDRLVDEAVAPLLAALAARGIDYRGVLYAGLMLTPDGPKVLEFNVRFGDPETQVVLPRLDGDLAALLAEVATGRLSTVPRFVDDAAVCVVAAAEGYPGSPRTGDAISGLGDDGALADGFADGVTVFHAGTRRDGLGRLVTAGGRVLGVTGVGRDIDEARRRAYAGMEGISWPGMQVRTDIAGDVLTRMPTPTAPTAATATTTAPPAAPPARPVPPVTAVTAVTAGSGPGEERAR